SVPLIALSLAAAGAPASGARARRPGTKHGRELWPALRVPLADGCYRRTAAGKVPRDRLPDPCMSSDARVLLFHNASVAARKTAASRYWPSSTGAGASLVEFGSNA